MIPITLQIKNFLSYGDPIQTIDFGHYSLICLSGKNGHGKSALLDAITWALWGQARKIGGTAKADQGLLRLGQTQMMVCLDFECGGQRYRVKREFMQTYGKPVTLLEFGILETGSGKYTPLTEKTLRDTQAKIDQTLHLTFEGFTNSAFLRQGQANEFSKKSPKERKEVLSMILGLDRYENIRRLAAERVRQANNQKQYLAAVLAKLDQELAQSSLLEQKEAALEAEQKAIQELEDSQKTLLKHYEQGTKELDAQKQAFSLLLFKKQKTLDEQKKHTQTLTQMVNQWRLWHRLQLAQPNFAELEKEKNRLVTHIASYQKQLQEHLNIQQEALITKEKLSQLINAFQEQKSRSINQHIITIERLQTQASHHQKSIEDETARQHKLNQSRELTQKELASLVEKIPQATPVSLERMEKQFEKRKEHYQQWIAQANMLSAQLNSNAKKNLLVIDEESPSCPLCEQNLSAARKRFLKKKFEDDSSFLSTRLHKLSMLIKKLKAILLEQHTYLEHERKQNQTRALMQQAVDEIHKKLAHITTELAEINAQRAKQQEMYDITLKTIENEKRALETNQAHIQKELQELPEYRELKTQLDLLERAKAEPTYNKSLHEQATQKLITIEKELQEYQSLQEQKVLQTQRAEQIALLCSHLKEIKKQVAQLTQEITEFEKIAGLEQELLVKKQELDTYAQTIAFKKELLHQERGSIEQLKRHLLESKKEASAYKTQEQECTHMIEDYQAIVQATGKDGIQALLIEEAIPEIELEANTLLSKLTENQTQLFIDSLRDLKKGGTKETLDIKISDAVGIRPYELFSGGEAFRIDFALRIAISKLLARRAGTSLQTLIIDEGFGSQDEEGLTHIMDALYKIQEDFAKIIIVSHLNSMKNQFPVHFVIEKGPQGSHVHVLEQG